MITDNPSEIRAQNLPSTNLELCLYTDPLGDNKFKDNYILEKHVRALEPLTKILSYYESKKNSVCFKDSVPGMFC
jgi:hypothetical protein